MLWGEGLHGCLRETARVHYTAQPLREERLRVGISAFSTEAGEGRWEGDGRKGARVVCYLTG